MRPYKFILGCAVAAMICTATSVPNMQEPAAEEVVVKTEVTKVPYRIVYRFDRALGPGRMEKVQFGIDGEVTRTVQYTLKDGKLTDPKVLSEETVESVPAIFNMGQAGWTTSRGSYERAKVLTMQSTGYTRFENTNRTAMGLPAKFGVVAVDKRVIKLGTRLYVEGYGYAIAGDTGGAIKGNRIDLCFDEYQQAIRWGRRPVRVHILK